MRLAEAAQQSEALQALSLVLNVVQAVALAWIASRSSRVRRSDKLHAPDDDAG